MPNWVTSPRMLTAYVSLSERIESDWKGNNCTAFILNSQQCGLLWSNVMQVLIKKVYNLFYMFFFASCVVKNSVNLGLGGSEESTCPAGRRWDNADVFVSDPVLEPVRVSVLFAAQVDEVVRGSGRILRGHVPHDAERVTGHLTDLDVARCGKRGVHRCHLPLEMEINVNMSWNTVTRLAVHDTGQIYLKMVTKKI